MLDEEGKNSIFRIVQKKSLVLHVNYVLNHRIIENMAGLVCSLILDVRQINKQNALAA